MGGKRPQQIHKDKQSTDFKTRTDDQRIHEEDKHLLHEQRGKLAHQADAAPQPEPDSTGDDV